jgi:hypothetical protein
VIACALRRQALFVYSARDSPANEAVAGRFQQFDGRMLGFVETHQSVAVREALDDLLGLVAFIALENV